MSKTPAGTKTEAAENGGKMKRKAYEKELRQAAGRAVPVCRIG